MNGDTVAMNSDGSKDMLICDQDKNDQADIVDRDSVDKQTNGQDSTKLEKSKSNEELPAGNIKMKAPISALDVDSNFTINGVNKCKDDPDKSKDDPDGSKDDPDTNKDNSDGSKDDPDECKDYPGGNKGDPDASKHDSDASKDNSDGSKDDPDECKDYPGGNKGDPDASKDDSEGSKDDSNGNKDNPNGNKDDSEEIVGDPDKATSREIEDVTLNAGMLHCEEKVAESDTDPLAAHSSDTEMTVKPSRKKISSPLFHDEAVSVNSESDEDELLCLGETTPNSDIILIDEEQQNGSSEVHEILSDDETDDCIVTSEKKNDADLVPLALRRTKKPVNRESLRDSEDEQESDLELIPINDPLNNKVKKNNAKKRLTAIEKRKVKKPPGILVVDPMDIVNKKKKSSIPTKKYALDNKKLHANIAACGTTITPVPAKDSSTLSKEKHPGKEPEPILPSLTDDMFVVEAPSFIVPYVYEKPAEVHFRKFVDKLGIELEEQKAKEEELRLQKEKEEKERREKEIQERKERGEDYSDLLEDKQKEKDSKEEEKQKRKLLKEERRRKRKAADDDDPAWEADNTDSSTSEDISDDDVKSLALDDLPVSPAKPPGDSFFTTNLAKFFIDIGLNLVQESVQSDLLKQENRKLKKETRGGFNTKATQSSIAALSSNLEKSKEKNAEYKFKIHKCQLCSFKSESSIVMANHMEVPHMKNNMFVCNFCLREIKGCHDILVHMLLEHQVKGRLERAQVPQQCSTCPYEDNNKARMARHILPCMKKFKPDTNLAIVDWEPPAKIPKLIKPPPSNSFLTSRGNYAAVNVNRTAGPQTAGMNAFQARTINQGKPIRQITPAPRTLAAPNVLQRTRPGMEGEKAPSTLSISPLPRASGETPTDNQFVICEICDGYIKDLDHLRTHMLWIHKIKIHPKMIHNRPPLNCQKCQFRFFTDQGLERHLLGAHGLVTNSMQEAANSRKDCGRCPICGKVYQYKLLGHVARDHNMILKPAHLSYKCTVCTATFDTYKEFESHVYSAHRLVTKRLAEKPKVSETSK